MARKVPLALDLVWCFDLRNVTSQGLRSMSPANRLICCPKGPRTQIMVVFWALTSYYLGPWTPRFGVLTQLKCCGEGGWTRSHKRVKFRQFPFWQPHNKDQRIVVFIQGGFWDVCGLSRQSSFIINPELQARKRRLRNFPKAEDARILNAVALAFILDRASVCF